MIKSFLIHIWLLLTFRHDGRGLPDSVGWTLFLCGLTAFAHWVRWGGPISYPIAYVALGVAIWLTVVNLRVICGALMICASTDFLLALAGSWANEGFQRLVIWALVAAMLLVFYKRAVVDIRKASSSGNP